MISCCFSSNSEEQEQEQEREQFVTSCIYQTNLLNSPYLLTLTWSLSLSSHSHTLSLQSSPPFLSTTLSLSSPPTSKSISKLKLKLHWNFSKAIYNSPNSPQPISSFYLAILSFDSNNLQFFLGDLIHDFARRVPSAAAMIRHSLPDHPVVLSRRDHVFGWQSCYVSRALLLGSQREIVVELSAGVLKVVVDAEIKLAVKRIAWKFRGNDRFFISGNAVDFYWDVFNWVKTDGGGGAGVFVFQVGEGAGVWPEVIGPETKLMKRCISSASAPSNAGLPAMLAAGSSSSVMQWAEESSSSDGGRSSCSSSSRSSGVNGGFSLLLYAWRTD